MVGVGGKEYIVEGAVTGDIGIVNGVKGDEGGKVIFDKSGGNRKGIVGMGGEWTIGEVEEIVGVGRVHGE
ncbi:CoA-transferase, partial [Bacillus sp. WP8]|uniref:CoA-transferase n=1 Tax=Bacillus sp. WP8 TaxID=756828 RepID=UPI0028CB5FF8